MFTRRRLALVATTVALFALSRPPAAGQDSQPATSAPAVVARVNDMPIHDTDVAAFLDAAQQRAPYALPPGLPPPPADRQAALERLIDLTLLDQAADRAGIQVSEGELTETVKAELKAFMYERELSPNDFTPRLVWEQGCGLPEFVQRSIADPATQRRLRHDKLIDTQYPEEVLINEAELNALYQQLQDTAYSRPTQVRARHVLISAPPDDPDARTAARDRATELLTLARTPQTNFVALARLHSAGPTRDIGGELGYFSRDEWLPAPLAQAAHAGRPGRITNLIETPTGFHFLQVLAERPARVVPYARVRVAVVERLRTEKRTARQARLVAQLRREAQIEYIRPSEHH